MQRQQLGIAVALLATLVVMWLAQPAPPARRAADGDVVLWSLEPQQVHRVQTASWTVDVAAGVMHAGGDTWPLQPEAGHGLVDAIVEAGRGLAVDGDDYGLAAGVEVTVYGAQGATRVRVGDPAPGGRDYVEVRGQVVAVFGGIGEAVRRPADDYRASP